MILYDNILVERIAAVMDSILEVMVMMGKIKKPVREETGFTLVELMVVILIIGILVAIAIPSFVLLRNKGYQAQAKSSLRNGVSAAGVYGTDHSSDYSGMTAAILHNQYEQSIAFADGAGALPNTVYISGIGADTYVMTVTAKDGTVYTATKAAGLAIAYNF
jgi:type IV pilus assembly protein PilA